MSCFPYFFVVYCKKMSKEGTGMTLEELCARVPELNNYLKFMPQELNERYWIHT